jgi:hypothetical protein
MASTSPANGPNPTIPVLLTDLDSAVQAEKQIEITRDAGPLACFLTATNDKPRRINLNGANWQVDLKGKKIPVQVVAKGLPHYHQDPPSHGRRLRHRQVGPQSATCAALPPGKPPLALSSKGGMDWRLLPDQGVVESSL